MSSSTPIVKGKISRNSGGEKSDVPGVRVFVVASIIEQLNNGLLGEEEKKAEELSFVFE